MLSHHDSGNLWFNDEDKEIIIEEINRKFPPGSVALLSACSLAATGDNQAILKKLNQNGIDAMIISPFPVNADYGTMLALKFLEALEEARKNPQGLTLAQLFATARDKTSKYFEKERGCNFEDMDLEFVIAGDYRIGTAFKTEEAREGGSGK